MSKKRYMAEFFAHPIGSVPQLTRELVTQSSYQTCICVDQNFEARCTDENFGEETFSFRIFCTTFPQQLNVFRSEQSYKSLFKENSYMTRTQQKEFFLDLRSCCDCNIMGIVSGSSHEAGEDFHIPDERLRFHDAPKAKQSEMVSQHIIQILRTSLPESGAPEERGMIYFIEDRYDASHVMIGSSLGTSKKAVRTYARRCWPRAWMVCCLKNVTNVNRVYKLISAELALYERETLCLKCGDTHRKWYKIRTDVGEKVAVHWASWMADQPYSTPDRLLTQFWDGQVKSAESSRIAPVTESVISEGDSWHQWTTRRGKTTSSMGTDDSDYTFSLTRYFRGE